jgi:hypothetical protein
MLKIKWTDRIKYSEVFQRGKKTTLKLKKKRTPLMDRA